MKGKTIGKMLGKDKNIIGIIGKNGKSTIAHMINHCYNSLGLVSEIQTPTEFFEKIHHESYEKTAKDVIIEVSMCDINSKRVSYLAFDTLLFTGSGKFSSKDALWTMKRPFIQLPIDKTAIINIDDEAHSALSDVTIANIITYGLTNRAQIWARNISLSFDKTTFDLYSEGDYIKTIELPYFGIYNVYNCLATIAYFVSEGYTPARMAEFFQTLPQIKGKFEQILTKNQNRIIIDYARNPEAIQSILKGINAASTHHVITVVGADGHHSKAVCEEIGKAALAGSKYVIFTTDNPREKAPNHIIYDMIKNNIKQNYRIVLDREKAIEIALKMAKPTDVVAILGKGHEKMQIIDQKTIPFCDHTVATYFVQKFEI